MNLLSGDVKFHNDYIGRPFMMTDSTPEPIWYADYYPFGEVMYENGSIEVGDPATSSIKYPIRRLLKIFLPPPNSVRATP